MINRRVGASPQIDVEGGAAADTGEDGGNGRAILGAINNLGPVISVRNASETVSVAPITGFNPFTDSSMPLMSNIQSGAETFGLSFMSVSDVNNYYEDLTPFFTGLFSDNPSVGRGNENIAVAVVDAENFLGLDEVDVRANGLEYTGYDLAILANIADGAGVDAISNVRFGLAGSERELIIGGWTRQAEFGGDGVNAVIPSLEAGQVYVFLVDEGTTVDDLGLTFEDAEGTSFDLASSIGFDGERFGVRYILRSPGTSLDFNGDLVLDALDVFAFLNAYEDFSFDADINGDRFVDETDLFGYLGLFEAAQGNTGP